MYRYQVKKALQNERFYAVCSKYETENKECIVQDFPVLCCAPQRAFQNSPGCCRGMRPEKDAHEAGKAIGKLLYECLGWIWLGRIDARRTVRQVLLNCVKPTPDSIFGELIDPDVNAAISVAKDKIERKKNRPSKHCYA